MPDKNGDNRGRPEISREEILQKLEPYLKSGLNVRKSLKEAGIPASTFYYLMDRDEDFLDTITKYRQFISILLNNSMIKQLQEIIAKQTAKIPLIKEEKDFLKWFATNSNLTREEYGERREVSSYDPEAEINRLGRLIDEQSKGGKDASKK